MGELKGFMPKLKDLTEEMFHYMEAVENDHAPNGAWWAMLEDAAKQFADDHNRIVDKNQAVQDYLIWCIQQNAEE
jgi:hypothetical protein